MIEEQLLWYWETLAIDIDDTHIFAIAEKDTSKSTGTLVYRRLILGLNIQNRLQWYEFQRIFALP